MPKTSTRVKEENFNFRVPSDLKTAFLELAKAAERPAAQVIRGFMRTYVEEHERAEAGYEKWLRQQVQAAIHDPRSGASPAQLRRRARALIGRNAEGTDKPQL